MADPWQEAGVLSDRLAAALEADSVRDDDPPGSTYARAYGRLLGALQAHPETLRALVEFFENRPTARPRR